METKRQQKYAQLILEEMASIFMKEGKQILGEAFVTLSDVKMTPDLGVAKIYLSLQFISNRAEVLKALTQNTNFYRNALGKRIRKVARTVPELRFYEDDTLDEAAKMNDLMNKLNIPPAASPE